MTLMITELKPKTAGIFGKIDPDNNCKNSTYSNIP